MARSATVYCGRCEHQVAPRRVWSGFLWIRRAWYAGLFVLCLLMPIIMAEITVLLPLALTFALAAGPVHALAAARSTCEECGAELA
ncbi:MAG TPA: hypothetical protein VG963_00300 [Polyangiaceae bacterium]|nr:hypothetical protein [Polyangiaceae bacterium]